MFRSALRGLEARTRLQVPLIRPQAQKIALARYGPRGPGFVRQITSVQPVRKKRRWPLVLFGLTIVGAYGYWKWLTHHNFPPSVAKLLKEGLWATINGAGYRKPDYKKALGKYIEALIEADNLHMVPWSDEYTGIQMVIADLYERLHLYDEAALMYSEIANTYLIALSSGSIPKELRDKIITRDLRVALIAALLISTNPSSFRSAAGLLTPHMILATREAVKSSEELQFLLHQQPVFDMSYLRDMRSRQLPTSMLEHAWGSYKSELFAMRELMTGMATAKGEYMEALMLKLKTTQMMLVSGFTAGECLLSAANIGSLMYLHSVNMKFAAPQLDDVALDEDLNGNANVNDSEGFDPKELDKQPASKAMNSLIYRTLPPNPNKLQPTAKAFADLANTVFGEIIETVKDLDQRRTDFIPEAYVMALYGQGVIAVSNGDWTVAADRLSEARLRAKGSEIESLVESAEEEIAKVEKLRDMSEDDIKQIRVSELPSVDVMFWKLSPSVEDLDRPDLPEPRI